MVLLPHVEVTNRTPWASLHFQTANGLDQVRILFAVLPAGLLDAQFNHMGINPHRIHMGACNSDLWISNLFSIFVHSTGFSIGDLVRMKFFRDLVEVSGMVFDIVGS